MFPLFQLDFFCFFFPKIQSVFLFFFCLFQTVTIAVRATSASCRLSPPHRSRVPRAGRSAGKEFSQIWARPLTGTGPEALVLVVRKSLDRATFRQDRRAGELVRTSRTRCVCWFMYVRTYEHTYIHTYMYIFIYRYIFGYFVFFWSWYKGNENHSLIFLFVCLFVCFCLLEEKFRDFRKVGRSRPFRVNF